MVIEEKFGDDERRLLLDLAICSLSLEKRKGDELTIRVIARLSGTDTVLIAKREYASAGNGWQHTALTP